MKERKLNCFQSWLHRTLQRMADAIESWGQRLEQKPIKQQPASDLDYKQQDAKQRAMKSNSRVKIPGTNVTGAGIYTQDWDRDETAEDRVARLKRLAMQNTKVNRRTK